MHFVSSHPWRLIGYIGINYVSTPEHPTLSPIRTAFFQHAQSSAPLMHAVLAVAAAILWSVKQDADIDIRFQVSKAVRGVNTALFEADQCHPPDFDAIFA